MKWIYRHPGVYDAVDTVCSLSFADRVRRSVLAGTKAGSFLEIGAGSGKNFAFVDSHLRIGLERSFTMLHHTRARFPDIIPVIGDAHMLPFRDACVSVSVFSYCLRGLAQPLVAVKEALRVSGKVIIIDYSKPHRMPRLVWEKVLNWVGWRLFGSRDIDFSALERLGSSSLSRDLYGGLYRVVVLKGAADAQG
jgi:ubiquinone/menaquinone biosynthesis C-methylase UbiE